VRSSKNDMHVAYARYMTYELGPAPREINEEQLLEDGPRVRALAIQRLELVWSVTESRIRADLDGTRPVDPRFLEIGLRAIKDETLLYRLSKTPPPVEEEEDPSLQAIDRVDLVNRYLETVEARIKQGQAAAAAWSKGKEPEDGAEVDLNDDSGPEVLGQDKAA